MRLTRTLGELLRCKRGNTLIVVAATAPLMVGASAIGLDTIQLTLAKRTLQRAADSAAIAGAYDVVRDSTPTQAEVESAVDRDLDLNTKITYSRTVQNAPQSGPFTGNSRAVRVVLQASRKVPFISFFTGSTMTVQVEATAAAVPSTRFCVLTLATTDTGLLFTGSGHTNLGCGIASNSTASTAISIEGGSATVNANPAAAPGGVPPAARFADPNTTVVPGSLPATDPYASLPDPENPPSPCVQRGHPVLEGAGPHPNLNPGCYTGMTLKSRVHLNPGEYWIGSGGILIEGGNGYVTGTGVTFLLHKNSGPVRFAGTARIELSAPTSGTYAGILMFRSKFASAQTNVFQGNSNTRLTGAIYMPSQSVTFDGNTAWTATCLRLVSLRATFTGSVGLSNSCTATGDDRDFAAGLAVRLVN